VSAELGRPARRSAQFETRALDLVHCGDRSMGL
jgi:hypothetical protein